MRRQGENFVQCSYDPIPINNRYASQSARHYASELVDQYLYEPVEVKLHFHLSLLKF